MTPSVEVRTWAGMTFRLAGEVAPRADATGTVVDEHPAQRYDNVDGLRLNRHGAGPFTSLAPPPLPTTAGGYVLTCDDEPVYTGIADDLRRRWGSSGYAKIQPRNCFVGGQSTNCKVNAAILREWRAGRRFLLWVREGLDGHAEERVLISALRPRWNGTR